MGAAGAAVLLAGLSTGGGTPATYATSFNGGQSMNVNASHETCNDAHPATVEMSDHNQCVDTLAPGVTPYRTKTEFEDGSVLTTPTLLSFVSGLVQTTQADGTKIGEIVSDVDLLCDGNIDRLLDTDIDQESTVPAFVDVPPSYTLAGYAKADITEIDLAPIDGATLTLPNAVTLSFVNLDPTFAVDNTAPNTYGSFVILGGDPNPPTNPPLCTQSPQRATSNFGGAFGTSPYTIPASSDPVIIWDVFLPSTQDFKDGFTQAGPFGGTHEASTTAVSADVLRNVMCIAIDTSACPANGNAEGELWDDDDADGLPDIVEERWGSDPNDPDTDNDGLNDAEEMIGLTDPTDKDSDGDVAANGRERTDAVDNCPNVANAVQTDSDGDTVGDDCDTDGDQDGALDDAEDAEIGLVWADIDPLTVGEQGGIVCRNSADVGGPGSAAAIPLDSTDADTDGDGILDGIECVLGSAPGNSNGTGLTAVILICGIDNVPLGPGPEDCTTGVFAPGSGFGTPVVIGPAASSRVELIGNTADDDLDGLTDEGTGNFGDADSDGLINVVEVAEHTSCARFAEPAAYPPIASCSTDFSGTRFNNNFDGDGIPTGVIDPDSDNEGGCAGWSSASGYPIPVGAAGCDGPEYFTGGAPAMTNEDGDGLGWIKSSGAGTRGTAGLEGFGFAGLGGCSAAEEASLAVGTDADPRSFRDVNASGNVDVADVGLVKGASGGTAGDGTGKYKRSLDLNAATASSGKGSGNIDVADIGSVKAHTGKSCSGAP